MENIVFMVTWTLNLFAFSKVYLPIVECKLNRIGEDMAPWGNPAAIGIKDEISDPIFVFIKLK